ncbi:MAG TPA: tandem-95 repeat protein [Nocardioidaceae bacterium]|nr:tandem-95 repeat protein [Nocardioidaceae bacterium]
MAEQAVGDARHWHARPAQAFAIRAVVFAAPIAVSIVVGIAVSKLLPQPGTRLEIVLWWIAVMCVSTAALYAADKVARRLLPLATLMRLSMLFPDHAPSRLKVARRFAGSRAIARELDAAHRHGVTGNRQEAAETILALVGALGEYDSRTRGHSERTQLYVTMLADELGLKAEDRGRLMWAALVHDIGKLKVPHEVLNKPGKPTEDEWHVLHSHPVQGATICEPLREWLGDWWLAIEQHHEKYDGTGYPRGLAGKQISYGARIVTVADSYEVMTAARSYKRPMTAEAARQELIRCAGTHFDPEVVRAFLNISLGDMSRLSGPLAWLAQLLVIRPGPLLGQALGAGTSAAVTATSVAALSLAPAIAGTAGHQVAESPLDRARSANASSPSDSSSTAGESPASASPPTQPTNPNSPTSTPSSEPTDTTSTSTGPTIPTDTTGPTTPSDTTSPTGQAGTFAVHNDALTTPEDTADAVDVAANDTAPSGSVTVVGVGTAAHGRTVLGSDGVVRYTPAADYSGSDSWTYTARDADGDTADATVSVIVTPVNDVPVAADDTVRVAEDSGSSALRLLANDSDADGDALTVTAVSDPQHGSVAGSPAAGFTFAPSNDFNGRDHLRYTVSDGHGGSTTAAVTVVVTPVNDAPMVGPSAYATRVGQLLSIGAAGGVLANASDVDGDDLRVVSDSSAAIDIRPDGSFTYVPLVVGQRSVTFRVSDGTTTTSGTMTISVTLLAPGHEVLYLRPSDTDEIGAMDPSMPGSGVSDWDHDGDPGLTVKSSNLDESETDARKFQTWSYAAPPGGLDLNGPVSLDLWTSLEGRAHEDLEYAAWVYECGPAGASCTRLLASGDVAVDNWSTTTTWEEREITIGAINATVEKDHLLRVRLMFHGRDVWLPLDAAHASSLTITTS